MTEIGIRGEIVEFDGDIKFYQRIEEPADYLDLYKRIDKTYDWYKNWLMKFNPYKCKIVHT